MSQSINSFSDYDISQTHDWEFSSLDKAISSDRRYIWQNATAAFNHTHLAWDSDTRIGIISSETESKRIVCNLPFENQLFGYIHYCTEISEININLLPNTCNFHRKFRSVIFWLHLSENAQNVHFREARFQSNFWRLEQLFPNLATSSNFWFFEQLLSNFVLIYWILLLVLLRLLMF